MVHHNEHVSIANAFNSLLFRQTNAQYINNKACIIKYSYMFQSIYIIFRESFLIYAKVTTSVKLRNH